MVITIDGPTASGKSSAAQLLAQKLGFYYLNSGLLYRALAYLLIHNKGYSLEQFKEPNAQDLDFFLDRSKLIYKQDTTSNAHVLFDGRDITDYLKDPSIAQGASIISAHKEVREKLLLFQRQISQHTDLVTDGRDMGTIVFPNADIKFYLTASPDVRARRWMIDQGNHGTTITIEKAISEINIRDERDSHRPIAPLTAPHDAIIIDNSSLSLAETVNLMYRRISELK